MKRISYILVVILLVGLLGGCSPNKSSNHFENNSDKYQWPVKNIEVVVPANAGGDTDFNARTMAKYFEEITGVNMVITNMAGAGGAIATSHVKESKSDGSIMLFSHTGQLIVNEISGIADYGYDAFETICIPAVDKGSVFVVSGDLGVDSLEDLIKLSKERKITYGAEFGSTTQIQGLELMEATEVKLDIVDGGNAAERVTGLLGGRLDMTSIPYGTIQDYIETGEMVAIAQLSGTKNPLIKDIETVKEQGFEFSMEKPYIVAYPKETDEELVYQTAKVMEDISKDPDYAKELETTYKQPVTYYNREDSLKLLKDILDDYKKYEDILKK